MTRTVCRIGLPVNRQTRHGGGGSGGGSGLQVRYPEGDNYKFVTQDGTPTLTLKTNDASGLLFQLYLDGPAGFEYIAWGQLTPDGAMTAPVANGLLFSNYHFATDNYLRFINFSAPASWHDIHVSEVANVLEYGTAHAFAPQATSDANTYNALFKFHAGNVSVFFRRISSGALFKPFMIDGGGGNYIPELTAI